MVSFTTHYYNRSIRSVSIQWVCILIITFCRDIPHHLCKMNHCLCVKIFLSQWILYQHVIISHLAPSIVKVKHYQWAPLAEKPAKLTLFISSSRCRLLISFASTTFRFSSSTITFSCWRRNTSADLKQAPAGLPNWSGGHTLYFKRGRKTFVDRKVTNNLQTNWKC